MTDVDFPFHFDGRGRTATAPYPDHVRDMIEQLLFTNPGDRVNRPDFGSGLQQLLFEPNSPELAAAVQVSVKAGLQRWLGDVIDVRELEVTSMDSQLRVLIEYVLVDTGEPQTAAFERSSDQ